MRRFIPILLALGLVSGCQEGSFVAPRDSNGDGFDDITGEPIDPLDTRDPIDPVDPMDPFDPMDPTDPTDPTDPMDPTDPRDELPEFEAHASFVQRLTQEQYKNSIRDIVGDYVTVEGDLEADTNLHGFLQLGAGRTSISARGTSLYETAAFSIAEQSLGNPARRASVVSCTPDAIEDPNCARIFVTEFGKKAFRRPLTEEERESYVQIARTSAVTLGDFWEGLKFAMAGILQSPNFLFRVELGEDDGSGKRRYTAYEMASRLSYFIWNSTPDDELINAAERGELATDDGLRVQARRLLSSTRSKVAIRSFFSQLFDFHLLDRLQKDEVLYADLPEDYTDSIAEETLLLIDAVTSDRNEDFRTVFTYESTFTNGTLQDLYGLSGPGGSEFVETPLPASGVRAGLLGHASMLAIHSHPAASSPTLRGRFIRQALLCGEIPAPPPDVDTQLPEPSPELPTVRDRLEVSHAPAACQSCHARMDPIGFALESFDTIGEFRTEENGAVIDTASDLDGVMFSDARELGQVLAEHPDLGPCLARKMYHYATGHVAVRTETRTLYDIHLAFEEGEHRLKALMLGVVMSEGFRTSKAPR